MINIRRAAIKTAQENYHSQQGLQQYCEIIFNDKVNRLSHPKSVALANPIQLITTALLEKPKTNHHVINQFRRATDQLTQLGLTSRELDVMKCLVIGMGDKVISNHLAISAKTVNQHVGNIIYKLGATSRTHAVAKALSSKKV